MANVQDKDLLSVAAENAFFCLYETCKENEGEIKAVSAYYIGQFYNILPKLYKIK